MDDWFKWWLVHIINIYIFTKYSAYIVVVHFIVLKLLGLTGNSVGLMGGCIFKDPKVASGVVPRFFMPMILFSGYFSNLGTM